MLFFVWFFFFRLIKVSQIIIIIIIITYVIIDKFLSSPSCLYFTFSLLSIFIALLFEFKYYLLYFLSAYKVYADNLNLENWFCFCSRTLHTYQVFYFNLSISLLRVWIRNWIKCTAQNVCCFNPCLAAIDVYGYLVWMSNRICEVNWSFCLVLIEEAEIFLY